MKHFCRRWENMDRHFYLHFLSIDRRLRERECGGGIHIHSWKCFWIMIHSMDKDKQIDQLLGNIISICKEKHVYFTSIYEYTRLRGFVKNL